MWLTKVVTVDILKVWFHPLYGDKLEWCQGHWAGLCAGHAKESGHVPRMYMVVLRAHCKHSSELQWLLSIIQVPDTDKPRHIKQKGDMIIINASIWITWKENQTFTCIFYMNCGCHSICNWWPTKNQPINVTWASSWIKAFPGIFEYFPKKYTWELDLPETQCFVDNITLVMGLVCTENVSGRAVALSNWLWLLQNHLRSSRNCPVGYLNTFPTQGWKQSSNVQYQNSPASKEQLAH